MSRTFYTYLYWMHNLHLTKDVGMIPYMMYRKFDYNSVVLTCRCDLRTYKRRKLINEAIVNESFCALKNEVNGLKIRFLKDRFGILGIEFATIFYLITNSRKIDVLNLYHYSLHNLLYGIIYKIINPSGFLFIKLDHTVRKTVVNSKIFNVFRYIKYFISLKTVDLFSVETKLGFDLCKKKFKDKVLYLPNGISEELVKSEGVIRKSFEQKDNIILIVGRIGAPEKNHQLIIQAITKINLKKWKVIFVGDVDYKFNDDIELFFECYPEKKDNVFFKGGAKTKKELYEYYNAAKIFCFSSNHESFGIVLAEAAYFGNYIISTDVGAASDITENGKIGSLFPIGNLQALVFYLEKAIDSEVFNGSYYMSQIKRCEEFFLWEKIVADLNDFIEKNG